MRYQMESPENGSVLLSGELSIENAGELKQLFLQAIAETRKIIVSWDDDIQMDLSCLQILCAVQKTASMTGHTLIFQKTIPKGLAETLKTCGLEKLIPGPNVQIDRIQKEGA